MDRAFESELDSVSGKVGFVTIIGRPNVGKSTFLNQVLRYHLSAVSSRPNTTRKKWLGILSDDDSQIIFSDTPGVHESRNKMHEAMAVTVKKSIDDNDVLLCICDASREFGDEDKMVASMVAEAKQPVILAVNKVDVATKAEVKAMKAAYLELIGEGATIFEISSLKGTRTDELIAAVKDLLPEGPFLFPKDQLADVIERDIAEEIIREAANELLYQELPQSLTVKIDSWNENEKKIKIQATLYVERKAQKPIVIGDKGTMVSSIIKSAREKLRVDLDKFIDVKLNVKVAADWQNKRSFLRDYGIVDQKGS